MATSSLIQDFGWRLRREAARLKWRGLAGLAGLVFVAGFVLSVLWPQQREIATLKDDVTELRARLRSVGDGPVTAAPPTRASQLGNFYAFFPGLDTLPDWVGQIHIAAKRNGLSLDQGDYQLQQTARERLLRYQIRLPVKGTYPQLRGFIGDVLQKVPAAALDDVIVKRESAGQPLLDARVTFTIFLGAEP